MKTLDFKQHLAECQRRAKILGSATAFQGNLVAPDGTPLETVFQGALAVGEEAQRDQKEASDRMRKLLERARNKEQDAVDELNELRMDRIDLYVRATSGYASMMYRTVTLKDNEQACIETSYRNPVRARYIGQDGGSRTVKAVKARKQVFIDMKEITSDDVGYQMRDIQQGTDIEAQSQATVDLSFDITNKVDLEAYNLLIGGTINGNNYGTGIFGAFNTASAALDKTYLPHPRINTANLPTTNDFANSALDDAGTATDTGLFRLSVIRLILKYCAQWGNIFGSPVRPTGAIFVPSSELLGLAQEVKPTGIVNNPVAEGIMMNYITFDYMGVRWTLIPDVTLPKGRCFPVLNRPVGTMLVKPSMDQEFVESNPRKNWETRAVTKVVNFYTLEPDRVFAMRIAYTGSPAAQGTNE
jgi:hypothetical protein